MGKQLYPDSRLSMIKAWKDPLDFVKLMRDDYEKRIEELEAKVVKLEEELEQERYEYLNMLERT